MLDALKRHCERLAADHLYCENVMDTYANARVSITFQISRRFCKSALLPLP